MLLKEFMYAARRLRKAPGFALTAMLTLALGISASTAVFTVLDSVVLEPLSYRDSHQLVAVWERVQLISTEATGPNPRHVDLWQKRNTVFSGLTLFAYGRGGLAVGSEHPRLVGTVSGYTNLFDVLRVEPLLGRTFRTEDGVAGRDKVAILTYQAWHDLFNGEPDVIGKTIRLSETPREIIGVLPATFHFPNGNALRSFRSKQRASSVPEPAVFVPDVIDLNTISWNGDYGNSLVVGRLKSGTSLKQAEAQLTAIDAQMMQEVAGYSGDKRPGALTVQVQPMQEAIVSEVRSALWLLMAAVSGLILIACLNLANAQIGRAILREREAAVRSALGAPSLQLLMSSFAESVLLAAGGGSAGVFLAGTAISLVRRFPPMDLPRLAEVHLNATVLGFALVTTVGSSLIFGISPALRFLRTDPNTALQQNNSHTLGSRQSRQLRSSLVVLQVFGCATLLLLTGLFSKSLLRLLHEDKGFDTGHVVVAEVRLSPSNYGADQSRTAFIDAVLDNLRRVPGVQSAGLVSSMPLEGETWIEQLSRPGQPGRQILINLRWISPGYFEAMREPLVRGRVLEDRDRNLGHAVVSEQTARALWGNDNPIGSAMEVEGRKFTVVGIVGDARSTSLKSTPAKMAYLHYEDRPPYQVVFTVRGLQPADQLISGVREAIWQYAPETTIARVKTLDSQLSDSLAPEQLQTTLLSAFAVSALLLAMLGIYGVLSCSVAGRTQEIGLRMALGASRGQMYTLTFAEAMMPFLVGLAAGLVGGALAARAVRGLLYEFRMIDPSVDAMVAAVLLIAASVAAFLPARRAASVEPMEALRNE